MMETKVATRMPVNSDELLELRGFNDVDTDTLKQLPSRLGAASKAQRAEPHVIIDTLSSLVGHPLREAYAVERMLMALTGHAENGLVEVSDAVIALSFLSNGTVVERLRAMFEALASSDGSSGVGSEAAAGAPQLHGEGLPQLLDVLSSTGQLPAEKLVCVEDEGKNEMGISRSWYKIQQAHEFTGTELAVSAVQALLRPEGAATPPSEGEGAAPHVPAAEALPETADEQRAVLRSTRLDVEQFVQLLQSQQVCVWGECRLIAERAKLEKQRREAEEYERNPPKWQFWKWGRQPAAVKEQRAAGEDGSSN